MSAKAKTKEPSFSWTKPLMLLASMVVGYGIYEGRKLFKFASDFQVHITNFGFPTISQGRIYFPTTIEIDNPTATSLKLDSIFCTVSRFETTQGVPQWTVLGNSQPDLLDITINPLKTTQVKPEISVPLSSLPSAIINMFQNKATGRTFKLDVKIGLAGNTLTTTEIIKF